MAKKRYEPPKLQAYGDLRSLTQAGTGLTTETYCPSDPRATNKTRTPRTNC